MMKKTIFILTALAALACTAISCRKEFAEMQQGATGFTVTATIAGGGTAENGTKVSATDDGSSLALKWEQGDKLIGFDDATPRNTYGFEVTSVAGGKATLTRIEDGDENEKGTATTDPADGTTMYMLYVPGKTVADLNLNSPNDILNYDLSTQAENALPVSMTAQGTVNEGKLDLTFNVKTAIIGIRNPKMVSATTSSIILSSAAALNTKVTFSLDGGNLKATYGAGSAGTVTKAVSYDSATPTSNTYIVVCPVTSAADLTFTSDKGEAFTKENKTVAAGKYYYMTPTFKSTGREITVSFGSATSALFGGGSALGFDTNKKIKVSNGMDAPEDCDITVTGGTTTIKTTLTGPLTLAYPADKAETSGSNIVMNVPASQDGSELNADDLRAMASIGETGTEATLDNCTSIFKITLPALTMTKLEIRSLPAAKNQVSRAGEKADINTSGTDKSIVTISSPSSGGTYYVFLNQGVKLSDLAFDAVTGTYTGSMAGIPNKEIIERNAVYATANTPPTTACYEIPADNFHPYLKVEDVKWAKMNIGAEKESECGQYFAWGEIVGHKAIGTISSGSISNAFKTDFTDFNHSDQRYRNSDSSNNPDDRWNASSGFKNTFENTPYYTGSGWWKYTAENEVLELKDDAAFHNWGGPWGIPTKDNFVDMDQSNTTTKSSRFYTSGNGSTNNVTETKYGYKFTEKFESTTLTMYLPSAGNGSDLYVKGRYASKTNQGNCHYWSKTYYGGTENCPYLFYVYYGGSSIPSITIKTDKNDVPRSQGCSIRPVSIY